MIKISRVVKAGKLFHQGKWLTRGQIQQNFPQLMGELSMQWIPLLPKGGGLIQVILVATHLFQLAPLDNF
jgi:hypothetical protein